MLKKQAIGGMCAAVEHIRDCQRCRRIYAVAFEVFRQEGTLSTLNPWTVCFHCSRELHEYKHWPNGI